MTEICPKSGLTLWTVDHIVWFAFYYLGIVVQPHQRRWLEHIINGGDDILILAPRGHGKTTTIMEVYLLYNICYNPDVKILLASHKEAVARRQARSIQIHLLRKKIVQDFEIAKDSPWTRTEFYIKHKGESKDEPVCFTVSGEGGVTGYRFDIIVFDDLLVKRNQSSESIRQKLQEWIDDEVFGAGDPGYKTIIVGTRKHYLDWYSKLLEDTAYDTLVDKAELDDGSFLWPWQVDEHGTKIKRKFDRAELERRKKKHGPRSYAQEYMNEVVPPEGMWLKREWIKYYTELPEEQYLDVYMGIDLAMEGETKEGSCLAIAVIAYDHRIDHRQIYVVDLYKSKPNPTYAEQLAKIEEMNATWKPVYCNVEDVIANKYLSRQVRDRFPDNFFPVDYIHTKLKGVSDVSKELRIKNYIGLYFEDGFVSMKDPAYDYKVREFIETEYIEFPDGEKDLLDALNLAVDLVDTSSESSSVPLYGF